MEIDELDDTYVGSVYGTELSTVEFSEEESCRMDQINFIANRTFQAEQPKNPYINNEKHHHIYTDSTSKHQI